MDRKTNMDNAQLYGRQMQRLKSRAACATLGLFGPHNVYPGRDEKQDPATCELHSPPQPPGTKNQFSWVLARRLYNKDPVSRFATVAAE
jgi:hypothetical protein